MNDPGSSGGPEKLPPGLRAVGLGRRFVTAAGPVDAVRDVTVTVPTGQFIVVRGRSGSGKTTLLNLLGALDRPTTGRVWHGDDLVSDLTENELVAVRRRTGFVFQSFGLLPALTAADNVGIPLRLTRTPTEQRQQRVAELLTAVGLNERGHHRPVELSGGQQQRVCIARALAAEPALLIADEPTAQLDSATGDGIVRLLREVAEARTADRPLTVLVSTHDPAIADQADRVLELADGRLVGDSLPMA